MDGDILFFFFKQKTAYEMLRSLVGSEMCIRDSRHTDAETSFSSGQLDHSLHRLSGRQGKGESHRSRLGVSAGVGLVHDLKAGNLLQQALPSAAVSYTHLTLPTISSV